MAGMDMSTLLPLMMGGMSGGKNLNTQDLMAMMMRGGQTAEPQPPPQQQGGNMQMQMMMQMMQMMNKGNNSNNTAHQKPPQSVGFRPVDGICPILPMLKKMMRK